LKLSDGKPSSKPSFAIMRLLILSLLIVAGGGSIAAAQPGGQAPPKAAGPAGGALPKIWHSEASHHDFNVDVTNDLFRAEWVNVPPEAKKQGVYIRTECRRSGAKWVGTSSINMLFGVPGAAAGKDTKICSLTVRFVVDSVSPTQITGHSESLHSFDVKTCRVQQTSWAAFTWTPKK
jgi:hypothetical protein